MISQPILLEANAVNWVLDELEVTRKNRKHKEELLERGVLASIRGIESLAEEPFVKDPGAYLNDLAQRADYNMAAVLEELRQDSVALKYFLAAECRLLQDLGLPPTAVGRVRAALIDAVLEGQATPENLSSQLSDLLDRLRQDLDGLKDSNRHRAIWQRVAGVLEVLGGALVIAGNALAVPATGPAAPLTLVVGAPLSAAAGQEVISRGVDRTRDA